VDADARDGALHRDLPGVAIAALALLGINSRIRWILEPGNEPFLVFNQGWAVEEAAFRALRSELTLKLGWTFRF
jgi:hypothetical protein